MPKVICVASLETQLVDTIHTTLSVICRETCVVIMAPMNIHLEFAPLQVTEFIRALTAARDEVAATMAWSPEAGNAGPDAS